MTDTLNGRPGARTFAIVGLCILLGVQCWVGDVVAGEAPGAVADNVAVTTPAGAPDIVLILLDDVGFAASSTFGGAIQTPALDALAAQGLRYNRFHVSALCAPTRAALLSGRNDHRVGFGGVPEGARDLPGYDARWKRSAATVAEVLRGHGYSTAAFGKWHNTPLREITPVGPFDRWPTGLGFEYFYGFLGPADSQWEPLLYRNTTPVEPSENPPAYHLTQDLADEAIRWVRTHELLAPERPYFLYFAPGATHEPYHVPREWINRYRGRFDTGWDRLNREIVARQKRLGVIPETTRPTPRPSGLPAWNSLSTPEKKLFARQMEVYAAFLAHTDFEVGRLLQVVRDSPRGHNTLVLYIVGDNGAEPGTPRGPDSDTPIAERLLQMGELGSRSAPGAYAAGWGWALSTPFQGMKTDASHLGGTRSPLVVAWPSRIQRPGIRRQFTHVTDIAPTLYEAAGVPFPAAVDGVQQLPLDGVSFGYTFDEPEAPSRHRTQIFEQLGNRSFYEDGWIASARHAVPWSESSTLDFSKDRWELYHLDEDFSESRDLASQYPKKLNELRTAFEVEAQRHEVYPLSDRLIDPGLFKPVDDRKVFVYYPGMPRIPSTSAPDFRRSHIITAEAVIPETGGEGLILSNGGRLGGFVLYVKDGHLVYERNDRGKERYVLVSTDSVPAGRVTLAYSFTRPGETASIDTHVSEPRGIGRLSINGRSAGEISLGDSGPSWWGVLTTGEVSGTPVSPAFTSPFRFQGRLEKITVEIK